MKKKVLVFLQSGVGGAERVTVTIGKSLDVERYTVIFCIVDRPLGRSTIEEFIPQSYQKVKVPNVKGIKQILALYKVMRQEKPDVVFSSIMHTNTKLLALSIFFPKVKFIVRNNNYIYTLSRSQKFVLKHTYGKADVIVAQTDEMKTELVREMKIQEGKIVVLPNPIDVETINVKVQQGNPYEEHGKIRFIASGRFVAAKGFDILVKAFALVLKVMPQSELYVVGNTEGICAGYFAMIKNLVEKLGIDSSIHFLGFQNNPYVFVKNADCFVLSSRNEGLPNVLIESLYLETPVAATKCIPVISRIVKEGIDGYLAEPENPESLSSAMLKACRLGRISSSYRPASLEDFERLFG